MPDTLLESRPLTLDDFTVPQRPVFEGVAVSLIDQLLEEQQQLTAVEEFASGCFTQTPDQARYYSKLLPATPPQIGQQYAFEVDLDRCSGCKACVVACHSLNGLDEHETWRDVGLLIGGTSAAPVMQHVTAACHHCVEPGCLIACPVNAYEKDTLTGIVRHLDDQCFGCQYCTLACPYNVPKYHAKKGIVRKCDMCSQRLATGEAPACVQACPHEAIAIRVVDIADVKANAEVDDFLPGAPEPHLTLPTTVYKSNRVFPRNTLPADYHSVSPQHPHWPLILMLVLTQLSVGAFITGCVLDATLSLEMASLFRPFHATLALAMGLLALAASIFHLGRPLYAFRGILGLRHSWLSREILAFGLFAGLAAPYAGLCWLSTMPAVRPRPLWVTTAFELLPQLGLGVAVVGAVGVFCSAMIYVFTKREFWSFEKTMVRFSLTSAVLGIATIWLALAVLPGFTNGSEWEPLVHSLTRPIAQSLIVVTTAKLIFELSLLRHLWDFRNSPLKRSAKLVTGVLHRVFWTRLYAGIAGGLLLPWWSLQSSPDNAGEWSAGLVALIWLGCLIGETAERYLFFAAVSAPRMPGGVRA